MDEFKYLEVTDRLSGEVDRIALGENTRELIRKLAASLHRTVDDVWNTLAGGGEIVTTRFVRRLSR